MAQSPFPFILRLNGRRLYISDLNDVIALLEKHHYNKASYYGLGLCLLLYDSTLKRIWQEHRGEVDRCFKECLACWLREADGAETPTIDTLIDALRGIGENAVADGINGERLSHPALTTQITQPVDVMTLNPGVCHLEHKIDEISELRKIGCNLQDKFDSLVLAVKKSLENDGIDVEDAKILIKVRLKRKARVIPRLMPCIDILEKVNDFNSLFEFLSKYDIIGYLNYKLLKKLSELVKDDDEINRLFFYYEEEYAKLLSSASIQDFIPYFKKESDLSHTTPLAKSDVSKWLKEGTVNLTVKRVQMLGPPGSGKTCSQRLLLNEDPPKEDNSTPIACRAVKATRISVEDGCMKEVDAKALLSRLARDLKKAAAKQKETPTQDSGTKSKEESSETIPTDSPETKSTESADSKKSVKTADDPHSNKILKDIVDAIPNAEANLNCNWVYIVDSGGQTAFQELLPLFTRAASLNIITIDLSKGMNEKLDLPYRINGKSFHCDSNFLYTNIEFLKDVLSSGAILQLYDTPQSNKAFRCPEYFVLGTHKDKATQKNIEEYNKELSSLKSGCTSYCIIPAVLNDDIIYPVNTMLESGPKRQAEAKNLCDTIYRDVSDDAFPMPVRWFAFELTLLEKAEALGRSFLQIDDVYLAGESLQMSRTDTEKALQHLHNVTIILYYPQVLPHIVFVDPHPILDILSRLLALTYKIDQWFLPRLTKETPSQSELDNLSKKGIFTESLLNKLEDDQGFSKHDFIKLLCDLHIICIVKSQDIQNTQDSYFIPSALPSYAGPPPGSNINPLLIVWSKPDVTEEILPVPHGIFPLAVVNLMKFKQPQFRFPQIHQKYFRCRDAMSFRVFIDNKHVGTIHIIKKNKCIEIYFKGKALEYCPLICEAVTEAISSSSIAINLKHLYKLAFACCSTENCYCIVTNEAEEKVECTLCDDSAVISGQEKYWSWFHGICTRQSSTEDPKTLNTTHLQKVLQLLREGGFNGDWEGLGLELGLYKQPTLSNIQHSYRTEGGEAALRECLATWLQRADAVDKYGGATYVSLANAVERLNQKAVADYIRRKCQIDDSQEEISSIESSENPQSKPVPAQDSCHIAEEEKEKQIAEESRVRQRILNVEQPQELSPSPRELKKAGSLCSYLQVMVAFICIALFAIAGIMSYMVFVIRNKRKFL